MPDHQGERTLLEGFASGFAQPYAVKAESERAVQSTFRELVALIHLLAVQSRPESRCSPRLPLHRSLRGAATACPVRIFSLAVGAKEHNDERLRELISDANWANGLREMLSRGWRAGRRAGCSALAEWDDGTGQGDSWPNHGTGSAAVRENSARRVLDLSGELVVSQAILQATCPSAGSGARARSQPLLWQRHPRRATRSGQADDGPTAGCIGATPPAATKRVRWRLLLGLPA